MPSIKSLTEIRRDINDATRSMNLGLPGSEPDKAKELLREALELLREDRIEEALPIIKKAKLYALPDRKYILSTALSLRRDGERLLKGNKFEEAISKFNEALQKYRQALEITQLEGLGEDSISRIKNTIDTTDNLLKIANFRRIFEKIKQAKNQNELWAALKELETTPVPMEDDRVDAIVFAHRKLVIMEMNSIIDLISQAAEMYKKGD
jgi:tetratricopeptide (TPR) repeat protein